MSFGNTQKSMSCEIKCAALDSFDRWDRPSMKKAAIGGLLWCENREGLVRGQDLNLRPSGYECPQNRFLMFPLVAWRF